MSFPTFASAAHPQFAQQSHHANVQLILPGRDLSGKRLFEAAEEIWKVAKARLYGESHRAGPGMQHPWLWHEFLQSFEDKARPLKTQPVYSSDLQELQSWLQQDRNQPGTHEDQLIMILLDSPPQSTPQVLAVYKVLLEINVGIAVEPVLRHAMHDGKPVHDQLMNLPVIHRKPCQGQLTLKEKGISARHGTPGCAKTLQKVFWDLAGFLNANALIGQAWPKFTREGQPLMNKYGQEIKDKTEAASPQLWKEAYNMSQKIFVDNGLYRCIIAKQDGNLNDSEFLIGDRKFWPYASCFRYLVKPRRQLFPYGDNRFDYLLRDAK